MRNPLVLNFFTDVFDNILIRKGKNVYKNTVKLRHFLL